MSRPHRLIDPTMRDIEVLHAVMPYAAAEADAAYAAPPLRFSLSAQHTRLSSTPTRACVKPTHCIVRCIERQARRGSQ